MSSYPSRGRIDTLNTTVDETADLGAAAYAKGWSDAVKHCGMYLRSAVAYLDEADEELSLNVSDPEASANGPATPVQRVRMSLEWAKQDLEKAMMVKP